jgi:hypothetical protein
MRGPDKTGTPVDGLSGSSRGVDAAGHARHKEPDVSNAFGDGDVSERAGELVGDRQDTAHAC